MWLNLLSNAKYIIYIVVVIVVCAVVYFTYDYGYSQGVAEARAQYDRTLSILIEKAKTESERVSSLEKQLAYSAAQYEKVRSNLSKVEKENAQWKKQFQESKKEAFSQPMAERLNFLLSRPSS